MRWIVAIVVFSACAGEPRAPVALEDYPAAQLEAFCRASVRCGGLASFDSCRQELVQFYYAPLSISLVAAIDAGVVKFDGVAARDCVDAMAARGCFEEPGDPYACTQVFIGTVAGGGACELYAECVSGMCSVPDCGQSCCAGTCFYGPQWFTAQIGDTCTDGLECRDGLYCYNYKCAEPVAAGGSCADFKRCESGSLCISQRCVPLPRAGEHCDDTLTCIDYNTRCGPTSHVCEELFAQLGEACGPDRLCTLLSRCDETSHCSIRKLPFGSSCKVFEDSCSDPDAYCQVVDMEGNAACARHVPDGASCDELHRCARGTCSTETHTCDPGPVCI